jgi:hypothetical protein
MSYGPEDLDLNGITIPEGRVPVTWINPETGEKEAIGQARLFVDTEGIKTLIEVNDVAAELMGLVSLSGVSITQGENDA